MKKLKKIIWCAVSLLTILLTWYLVDRFSYSGELPYYPVHAAGKDSVFTIGLIGDSWVAVKRLDTVIHNTLAENNINHKIISSGEPGAKTKLIYQNLFRKDSEPNSSKPIIESQPDYCIVVAGVNDAVGQLGKNYYAHHMSMIVKTLLHYKIKPIVVELPEFGIVEATDEMNIFKRERNKLYAYFTNGGELNNISAYREAFEKEITQQQIKDSIIYVDFNPVCEDFKECKALYTGASHLSMAGNVKLGKIIAQIIINHR